MATAWRAVAALLLLALPGAAWAEERISQFWSDVQVQPDSSLEVVETIDVRAEHYAINHGIYRDFPTRYRGRNGSRVHVGFTFHGAELDGTPVSASTAPFQNGIRIKIGDPAREVPIGDHRYVIRYRTTRQIGRFNGYDELYWNATGNGWVFPIDSAEARIRLPRAVNFGQRAAYTGPQGSTARYAEVVEEKPGEIAFRTTQPLGAYEGLTVAVAFPKGVVADAGEGTRAAWWLSDYGPPAVGFAALLGLLGFYYIAWLRAGRNPRPGTIVPIFSPPDELTPPAMRYVTKMGADNRTFAAALVDMGVRGHVRLREGGDDPGSVREIVSNWFGRKTMTIERLEGSQDLPREEEAALRELCSSGGSIVMEQKNYQKFTAAKKGLSDVLKGKYEGRLFLRNWGWAIAGVLLTLAAVWLPAAAVVAATDTGRIWQVGVALGLLALAAILVALVESSGAAGKFLFGLGAVVAGGIALLTGGPILIDGVNSGWWLPMLLPLLALPIVVSAFWWIAAPTKEGRAVLDRIAGFRQYLSITERERLDRMTAPEDTSELFERYLPYAIALGVENRWADRFQGVLAAAASQGQQGFGWYYGSSDPWSSPGRFVDNVGSSLTSAISSASTAPGSSSGSGGGGSSGGGGGGGGGGGW